MGATYERVKLTERVVQTAKPAVVDGNPRERLLFDTFSPLALRVSASGDSRSYFVQGRVDGRLVRDTFDRGAKLTVEQARKEARRRLGLMASGVNPINQRRAERAEARKAKAKGITLAQAMALRAATLRAKGRSDRTIEGDEYVLRKYLSDWLERELVTITREECRRRHRAIQTAIASGRYTRGSKFHKGHRRTAESGRTSADRAMRAFRAVWRRAARQHPELPPAPTINVDFHRAPRKAAPVGLEGLAALQAKIAALPSGVRRDWWLVALFTGLRRTSVSEMRWADVDLEARTLRVPNPKGGEARAFTLPLSGFLVELLAARKQEQAPLASPWVFPSPDAKSGHVEEPREDDLGITPHDCRRLFITVAESLDVSPYAIKLLVNHALPRGDVTGGYMTLDVERLRPVMEAITARLRAPLEVADNVVALAPRKVATP